VNIKIAVFWAVLFGMWLPMFQRKLLYQSSGNKMEAADSSEMLETTF
jgi:hypothetical protein